MPVIQTHIATNIHRPSWLRGCIWPLFSHCVLSCVWVWLPHPLSSLVVGRVPRSPWSWGGSLNHQSGILWLRVEIIRQLSIKHDCKWNFSFGRASHFGRLQCDPWRLSCWRWWDTKPSRRMNLSPFCWGGSYLNQSSLTSLWGEYFWVIHRVTLTIYSCMY